jgi:CpeT protein
MPFRSADLLPKILGPCLLALFTTCANPQSSAQNPRLMELQDWMTGSFSSAAQAEAAPDDYDDIRLVMVPIWEDRADGPWLYVEQAAEESLDRPYRQRVYHLSEGEGGPRSAIYTLPGDPLDFVAAWDKPELFAELTPADLSERSGCEIYLSDLGGIYVGSTQGRGCSSSLGDAAYATSEVTISVNKLTSWDRGFDQEGNQAWGATAGPYIFLREAD